MPYYKAVADGDGEATYLKGMADAARRSK